jgi:hypothetical protein
MDSQFLRAKALVWQYSVSARSGASYLLAPPGPATRHARC